MRRLKVRVLCGRIVAAAVVLVMAAASPGAAQDSGVGTAGRGPQFLVATARLSQPPVPVDVASVPMLRRRLSLNLVNATRQEALDAVSRASGLRLIYASGVTLREGRVRLKAEEITVAAALTEVLFDAGVDVLLTTSGNAVLVKRTAVRSLAIGAIAGRVTDAKTGDPLAGAEVWLEGTKRRSTTSDKGFYKLTDVEIGSYTLSVRRVGYVKQSRAVAVQEQELTVDVALQPTVTQLNEIVTTVTGEQRIRELGHVVGRINADSLAREAPVATLSELLNGRVSGFQVFQDQGTVGGRVTLQSRGPNSLLLNTEPIVIVDGVRYTSAFVRREYPYPFSGGLSAAEPTSPINDLNPNDIESIEIVKGPSAATLYGTDAANGVVVVTTKRGKVGPAQWRSYARVSRSGIPQQKFPDSFYPWGHDPNTNANMRCSLGSVAAGYCVQDSLMVLPNPLNDPEWTMLASHPAWNYGASVSGGRQDLRYFFAGDASDAAGPVRIPEALAKPLLQQRGTSELTDAEKKPNTTSQISLRANVSADLGRSANVNVNTGYVRGATRAINPTTNPYNNSVLYPSPTNPYGDNNYTPVNVFTTTSTERNDRFTASTSSQLRPLSWLDTRATIGLDLSTRMRYAITPNGEGTGGDLNGSVSDNRTRQLTLSGDLGLTANLRRRRVTSRSSIGAQYTRGVQDELRSYGSLLPPGGTSIGEARTITASQFYNETVTLGSYLEETLGFNDRLYLTGAVRIDGASAFGQNYEAAAYPKMSLSWILSDEPFLPRVRGLDELRLRYAYGASGQQARSAWTKLSYGSYRGTADGVTQTVVTVNGLGNPDLRPERVREHEFGFDLAALTQRVRLGLTWYKRRTTDQITSLNLGPGLGSIYTNLGLTTQHGFEAELTAAVLDSRRLSLDVIVHHGLHRTKLVKLGNGIPLKYYYGGWVEGYPLGARFSRSVEGYNDANNNGIIESSEVTYSANASYLGEGTPPISQTLTAVVGFFDRRIRLSTLFERRSGYIQIDALEAARCQGAQCRALLDINTPLMEQARARAMYNRVITDAQPGDFTRLREIAVAVDLPRSVTRALRVRSGTVNFAGRNIALWTKFKGPDPESASVGGPFPGGSQGVPVVGGQANGLPQTRSWTLRVDLGF